MDSFTIPTPDDMNLHIQQGKRAYSAIQYAAVHFGRAIIMPNTLPQVLTVDNARKYRDTIHRMTPQGVLFEPLMTLSLKPDTEPKTIRQAKLCGFIHGIELYAGSTDNSAGFEDMTVFYPALAEMESCDMPLIIHGEAPDYVDVFDREHVFYEKTLPKIKKDFPGLRIVCEHITTESACQFVLQTPSSVVATITPQHLIANRAYLLGSGLRPDAYSRPVLNREEDRVALLTVATSGNPKFFLGTDSIAHPIFGGPGAAKYTTCCCPGSFTSPVALALYAEAFDSVNALPKLADFASRFGREFYNLPANQGQILFTKQEYITDCALKFGNTYVSVFRSEKPLQWMVKRVERN